jgi:hypothetical protein
MLLEALVLTTVGCIYASVTYAMVTQVGHAPTYSVV